MDIYWLKWKHRFTWCIKTNISFRLSNRHVRVSVDHIWLFFGIFFVWVWVKVRLNWSFLCNISIRGELVVSEFSFAVKSAIQAGFLGGQNSYFTDVLCDPVWICQVCFSHATSVNIPEQITYCFSAKSKKSNPVRMYYSTLLLANLL